MEAIKLNIQNLFFNEVFPLSVKKPLPTINLQKTTPFVKWVGGKRSLLPVLLENMPKLYNIYYEPFIGGGALFFALQPKEAVLSDINKDLVITYNIVKKQPHELIKLLSKYKSLHCKEFYLKIRQQHFLNNLLSIAARFIYLNKTCYNGLYRVNNKGEFNVPIGKYKNPNIVDENNLLLCSKLLNSIKINYATFEQSLLHPQKNDFVYLDPPYYPINKNSFTKYNKNSFTEKNQIGLYFCCKELDKRGVKFMLSNSDTAFIANLYREFNIQTVKAPRMVNCKAQGRTSTNELLIKNY